MSPIEEYLEVYMVGDSVEFEMWDMMGNREILQGEIVDKNGITLYIHTVENKCHFITNSAILKRI